MNKFTLLYLFVFLCASLPLSAQNTFLSGTVREATTKAPLAGATVSIKGSTNTVATGANGAFTIKTYKTFPVTLQVSFVGYQARDVVVTSTQGPLLVELTGANAQLSEVAIIGYGTQRRKDLTGSVASVPKENLARPAASLDNLLQGSIAGVAVSQSSGQPGATATVRIRGGNSLSFGNDPLYVIDGFIYYNDNSLTNLAPLSGTSVTGVSTNALATIDPGQIESIDVLKDASATAIYGSRGANGVVIITTKRGVRGVSNVEYSGYYGVQEAGKQIAVLNGPEWAKYFDDLYKATPTIQTPTIAANKHIIDSLGAAGVNNNWAGATQRTGYIENHELSIYGGDEKSRYALSGGYFDQKGGILNTDFKRYSARLNYEKNVFERLKVSASIYGSTSSEDKLTGSGYNGINLSNAYSSLYSTVPLQGIKNPDGSYNTAYQAAYVATTNTINGQAYSDNPIQDIVSTTNRTNIVRLLGNVAAEYKLLKELTLKVAVGADDLNSKLNYYAPSYTAAGNSSGTIAGYGSVGSISYVSWLNENTLTYTHVFGERHFLDLLGGYTTQYQHAENVFAAGANFPSDLTTYENLYAASAQQVTGSGETQTVFNSWLGRVNYSYAHRYNLTLSGREDGASAAGANHKWGFFPSVGVSWNISDEGFFRNLTQWVSNLKVRASAGTTGNANFPAFSSLPVVSSAGYYFGNPLTAVNGLSQSQLGNPNLSWETTTQYDVGTDLGFLHRRIVLAADYYYKRTNHLYITGGGLVPLSTGYASVAENIGSLRNRGIELNLRTENIQGRYFSWTTSLTYAANANKVLSLGPSASFQPVAPTGQVSPVIIAVGLPVGTFWGYKTDGLLTSTDAYGQNPVPKLSGVSQQTGDRKYLHAPGLTGPVISTADKQNLGSAQPKFTGSLTNTFTYRDFDLSLFIQGSYGNKIFNYLEQQLEKTTTTGNVSAALLNRWDSVNNPHGTFPKVVNAPVMQVQDTYIENGSYIRLKNLTLGYTLKAKAASRFWAKQARIYVSVQNLLTITKYSGLDPEANFFDENNLQPGVDYGVYPNYKTYQVGVDVTF